LQYFLILEKTIYYHGFKLKGQTNGNIAIRLEAGKLARATGAILLTRQ